jgi:hypothetical protein
LRERTNLLKFYNRYKIFEMSFGEIKMIIWGKKLLLLLFLKKLKPAQKQAQI